VYGTLSEFNLAVGSEIRSSWDEYCERLKQYFLANDIDPDHADTQARRRAIFLSSVGAETYSLIRTLCLPDNPENKTLADIQKLVRKHIAPTPIVIAERFKFYNRGQMSGETVAAFLKELRQLAATCDFGDFREQVLRDMFVIKIRDKKVQEKLLGEADLTLERAFQLAQAAERAKFHVEEMSTEVHKMSFKPVPKPRTNLSKAPSNSSNAGSGGQTTSRPCFLCGSLEHWKAACPRNKGKSKFKYSKSQVKTVSEGLRPETRETNSDNEYEVEYSQKAVRMSKVCSGTSNEKRAIKATRKVPEIMVEIHINGTNVAMELDTGASVSLMSAKQFRKLGFDKVLQLKDSDIVLSTITGEELKVVGECSVRVGYQDQCHDNMLLYVVESEGPPLLGRDWLSKIQVDFSAIKSVSGGNGKSASEIMNRYAPLFDGGLGLVKELKASLELKEGANPRFFKPRTVPFAIKDEIASELDRLIESGVLKKVDYSDWAAPIVAVRKSNGKYRICGDYSVTVNKFLKVPEHPMPRIGELLAKLNGGKTFSKLDLSQAYQQIPLDDESQKLVTINTHLGLYTYTRVPYGISAAPSLFQSVMDKILQGIDCGCYLDDIVVTGRTQVEHERNLLLVLDRLTKYGFKLQKDKCEFFKPSIKYLGLLVLRASKSLQEVCR